MMRAAAGAALLLAAGACNQVFGIDETSAIPDVIVDAADASTTPAQPQLRVTYQQTVTSPAGVTSLAYPALPGAVTVRVGRAGEATVAATPVDRDGDGVADPGTAGTYEYAIEVMPDEAMHATIEAPAAGLVRTELYWTAGNEVPHLTVPIVGRQAASASEVPAGSGWSVRTSGGATPQFSRLLAFTTGSWTDGLRGAANEPYEWPFATNAVPLLGTRAVPDAALGDQVMLLAIPPGTPAGCTLSTTGAITFSPPPLVAGMLTPVPTPTTPPTPGPVFDADVTTFNPAYEVLPVTGKFKENLGVLGNEQGPGFTTVAGGHVAFGYLPTQLIPAFTRYERDHSVDRLPRPLPVPPMLTVVDCPLGVGVSGPLAPVDWLEQHAEPTGHLEVTSTRTFTSPVAGVGAVTLVSGLDMAVRTTGTGSAARAADFTVGSAQMPRGMLLMRGGMTRDLSGDADSAPMPGTGPLHLVWDVHLEDGEKSDFWSVTLVRLTMAGHVPVLVVITPTPGVDIPVDGVPSGEYTLELRAHTGYPKATTGDYSQVGFPQAMTTVSTRTFQL